MENKNKENLLIDVESINTSVRHVMLIGHLLDVMKYANQEDERLNEMGITFPGLGYVEGKIWDAIKGIVGMPLKEELGVFVDDIWISYTFKYFDGEMSKEEAVNFIMNWQSELKS